MVKGFISLILLFTIFLGGCSSSNASMNKNSTSKTSSSSDLVTTTSKKITSNVSNTTNKNKETIAKIKARPLTSSEKTKLNSKLNSAITSIDEVLNSLDEAKELNLN